VPATGATARPATVQLVITETFMGNGEKIPGLSNRTIYDEMGHETELHEYDFRAELL
jgi:hypothetical protein